MLVFLFGAAFGFGVGVYKTEVRALVEAVIDYFDDMMSK